MANIEPGSAIHESDGEVIDDQSNCLLLSRISQTELLVSSACANFSSVDGFSKLHRKLLREVDNLNMIKSEPNNLINKLKSSNISYYSGFIIVAGRYNCCSFFKTFMHSTDSGKQKVEVDIVAEHGTKWVKVCARNTRSLALESVGAGSANKSCLNHARIYMMLARKFPVLSRPPTVIIEFINRVPDFLVRKLLKIGVEVRGTQVPMTDFLSVPTLDSDDDDVDNCRTLLLPQPYHAEPECLNTINFDVSAVFVLISSMTEENGANYLFESKLLTMQAIEERKSPARRLLINAMKGKRLIMCASTYEAFQEIVATVAGPSEKKRAKEFLKIVEIVDDKSSERVDRMKFGLTITGRTRRIFSSGDYYRAITATSNRHFINAAQHQGETFAVLLLQSRALSEQKQIDPL